jgi:hypothetical protein
MPTHDSDLLEQLYDEALTFATELEALNHTTDSHNRQCVERNIKQSRAALCQTALEIYHNRNS